MLPDASPHLAVAGEVAAIGYHPQRPQLLLHLRRIDGPGIAGRRLLQEQGVNGGEFRFRPNALRARALVRYIPPLQVLANPRFFGANPGVRNRLSIYEVGHDWSSNGSRHQGEYRAFSGGPA